MATPKAKPKSKKARKSPGKGKSSAKKVAALNLGKYMEQIKVGSYS